MPQEVYDIIDTRRKVRSDLADRIRQIRALRTEDGARRLIPNRVIATAFQGELKAASMSRVTIPAVRRRMTNFLRFYPDLFVWGVDTAHLPCGIQDYRGDVLDAKVQGFIDEFHIYRTLVSEDFHRGQ